MGHFFEKNGYKQKPIDKYLQTWQIRASDHYTMYGPMFALKSGFRL